ncbi:selenocysteine-specific translation elongation factor [Peptostreptococcus equinus]|uniref:Selenocysteine-specific elongation factor n=1 Tax=Peptostreptococcus equinus TaxID=3003601 RepID=A0ABY7JQ12_9FIRM|nr:selenocysteine-specific translation elongation factor [Peptostreptococcus sp. CBA3647]WAW14258.1 selenocysteine-specific translation elongation factor [Peptostreptococcus sp. CBA3647]
MKHIVVGTAGHIDHGKTTLIKALTGRETDTLDEEKKRGISINLGFTYFDLPSGKSVGIVDVPGHEKFIKNMLAGAAGLDIVLLVVAADEGVMPQTVEHLDILSYLNIKNGLIVMTKCDMVDEELLELAEEDIRESLRGSFMDDADIIKVDSISRRGIDELINKLDILCEKVEEKDSNLPFRMNIDRVFSVKGFGTVVTGTILEGKIKNTDTLEIYPSKKIAQIRNIQVHSHNVDFAYAGQRTAINISNLKSSQIQRGDILAATDSMLESMMIDTKIRLLNHDDIKLENWDRLKIYHGTREILCRAVPLENEVMTKGQEGFVQLRLEEPIICKKLDAFVLRTYSPMITVGGGIIIDISDKKHGINKNTPKVIEELKIKELGDPKRVLEIYLKNSSSIYPSIENMMSYTGQSKESILSMLENLIKDNKIYNFSNKYIHESYLEFLQEKLLKILTEYHEENKLKIGMPKKEAGHKLDSSLKLKELDALYQLLEYMGHIKTSTNTVSKKDFDVILSDKDLKIKSSIIKEIEKLGYSDILDLEYFEEKGKDYKSIVDSMIGNELILLDGKFLFSKKLYDQAKSIVENIINKNKKMTIADFRDEVGSSRKISMLILEKFDKDNFTKRVENYRVLYTK